MMLPAVVVNTAIDRTQLILNTTKIEFNYWYCSLYFLPASIAG